MDKNYHGNPVFLEKPGRNQQLVDKQLAFTGSET